MNGLAALGWDRDDAAGLGVYQMGDWYNSGEVLAAEQRDAVLEIVGSGRHERGDGEAGRLHHGQDRQRSSCCRPGTRWRASGVPQHLPPPRHGPARGLRGGSAGTSRARTTSGASPSRARWLRCPNPTASSTAWTRAVGGYCLPPSPSGGAWCSPTRIRTPRALSESMAGLDRQLASFLSGPLRQVACVRLRGRLQLEAADREPRRRLPPVVPASSLAQPVRPPIVRVALFWRQLVEHGAAP